MRRLNAGLTTAIVAGGFIALIALSGVLSPSPPPDKHDDEFPGFSEACKKEVEASLAAMAVASKTGSAEGLHVSTCMDQETDQWIFDSCLKKQNGDRALCENMMKVIACLDKDDLDADCIQAMKAVQAVKGN
jgi:hypothetical protein